MKEEPGRQIQRCKGIDRQKENILDVKKSLSSRSTKKVKYVLNSQPQKNIFNPFLSKLREQGKRKNRDGEEYCEMLCIRHDLTFIQ